MAYSSSLKLNFSDNSYTSYFSSSFGGDAVSGGQLVLTATSQPCYLQSKTTYDLTNGIASIQLLSATNIAGITDNNYAGAGFLAFNDSAGSGAGWRIQAGTIQAFWFNNSNGQSNTANAGALGDYFRIRHVGSNLLMDYSADGKSWTNALTVATSSVFPSITSLTYVLSTTNTTGTSSINLDNLNILPISVIQRSSGFDNNGSTGSVASAFGSAVTAGNTLLAVAVFEGSNSAFNSLSATGSLGNTFTAVYSNFNATASMGIKVFASYSSAGGSSTITINDGYNLVNAYFYEVAGLGSSSAFDVGALTEQTSTGSLSSPAVTTTHANELLLGIFGVELNGATWTIGSGYTNGVNVNNGGSLSSYAEEQIVAATGSYSATATDSVTNSYAISAILAFADTPVVQPLTISTSESVSHTESAALQYVKNTIVGPPTGVSYDFAGNYGWQSMGYIYALDGNYVTAGGSNGQTSANLRINGYTLFVPSDATITGISATVYRKATAASSTNITDYAIRLVKPDGASFSSGNRADTATPWPTSVTAKTYGGANDLWGESWTPADVNSSNFGLAIANQTNDPSAFGVIGQVDYVTVTVYYAVGTTTAVAVSDSVSTSESRSLQEPTWYTSVDISVDDFSTTATSSGPTATWGQWQYNLADWPAGTQFALELVGGSNNASGAVIAQLYDVTGNAFVGPTVTLSGSGYATGYSNPVLLSTTLTDGHIYEVGVWSNNASYTAYFLRGSVLLYTPITSLASKKTYLPIAANNYFTNTTYSNFGGYTFIHDASKWDGSPTYQFQATLYQGSTGGTTYLQLYDLTAGAAVAGSQLSTSAAQTVQQFVSGNITLVDGHSYGVQAYTSAYDGTNGSLFDTPKIIVTQTNPTKWRNQLPLSGASWTTTSTSGGNNPEYRYIAASRWNSAKTLGWTFDGYLSTQTAGNTAYMQPSNLTDGLQGTVLSSTTTTETHLSEGITPSVNSGFDRWWNEKMWTSNSAAAAYSYNTQYIIDVTVSTDKNIALAGNVTTSESLTTPALSYTINTSDSSMVTENWYAGTVAQIHASDAVAVSGSQTLNGGGANALVDTFNGTSLDTGLWYNWGGTPVTVNNQLNITIAPNAAAGTYYGINSQLSYDLTGASMMMQVVADGHNAMPDLDRGMQLQKDSNNALAWVIYGDNSLQAKTHIAGTWTSQAFGTFDPVATQWLRIREAAGTVYWEYSADALNWTALYSMANPFAVTTMTLNLNAGVDATDANGTTVSFDNVNFATNIGLTTSSTMSVAESLALNLPVVVSRSEAVTASAAPSVLVPFVAPQYLNEYTYPSETYTVSPVSFISVSDSASSSELLLSAFALAILPSEAVTASEAVSLQLSYAPQASDAVTVTDVPSLQARVQASLSDAASLTDAATVTTILEPHVSEAVAVASSPTLVIPQLYLSVADAAATTESTHLYDGEGIYTLDGAALTEALNLYITELFAAVTDTVTSADSPTLSASTAIATSQAAAVAEVLTIVLPQLYAAAVDAASAGEALAVQVPLHIAVAETASHSDSLHTYLPFLAPDLSEAIATTESLSTAGSSHLSVSDAAAAADVASVETANEVVAVADHVTGSDAAAVAPPLVQISAAETAALTDSPNPHLTSHFAVADSAAAADSPHVAIPTLYVGLSDVVAAGDTVVLRYTLSLQTSSGVTVTPVATLDVPVALQVADAAVVAAAQKLLVAADLRLAEQVHGTDRGLASFGAYLAVAEVATVQEHQTVSPVSFVRTQDAAAGAESLNLLDSPSAQPQEYVGYGEQLTLLVEKDTLNLRLQPATVQVELPVLTINIKLQGKA